MSKVDEAISSFRDGFNCSQAVFSTYCEELGFNRYDALKIGSAFGAGMAYNGETCGAVTGALMLIGLKYGRTKIDDTEAKEKTYALAQEFVKRFKAKYGSICCKDLLEFDISTPEGLKKARAEGVFRTVCPRYVKISSQIIEEILF